MRRRRGGSRFPGGCSRCRGSCRCAGEGDAPGARASAVPAAAVPPSGPVPGRPRDAPRRRNGAGRTGASGSRSRRPCSGQRSEPFLQRGGRAGAVCRDRGPRSRRGGGMPTPLPRHGGGPGALPALPSPYPAAAFRELGWRGATRHPREPTRVCALYVSSPPPPPGVIPPRSWLPTFCPVGEVVFIPRIPPPQNANQLRTPLRSPTEPRFVARRS